MQKGAVVTEALPLCVDIGWQLYPRDSNVSWYQDDHGNQKGWQFLLPVQPFISDQNRTILKQFSETMRQESELKLFGRKTWLGLGVDWVGTWRDGNVSEGMEMNYSLIICGLRENLHLSKLIKLYTQCLCILLYVYYSFLIKKLFHFPYKKSNLFCSTGGHKRGNSDSLHFQPPFLVPIGKGQLEVPFLAPCVPLCS